MNNKWSVGGTTTLPPLNFSFFFFIYVIVDSQSIKKANWIWKSCGYLLSPFFSILFLNPFTLGCCLGRFIETGLPRAPVTSLSLKPLLTQQHLAPSLTPCLLDPSLGSDCTTFSWFPSSSCGHSPCSSSSASSMTPLTIEAPPHWPCENGGWWNLLPFMKRHLSSQSISIIPSSQ